MGTNLEVRDEGGQSEPIWLLNNKLTASPWIFKAPKSRRKLLQPAETYVHSGGKIASGTTQTETELRRRGWGEVAYMSYGEWLVWLENALNDATPDMDYGRKGLRAAMCNFAQPGLGKLADDEVELSYRYQFPVHAVGYNWLQSNAVSAAHLKTRISEITAHYRTRFNFRCDKVILVTHSMGGLVSRYYTEVLDGRDDVLGVVHGVMPATGAAAVYKRMKVGTEGVAGLALGPTAAAMTAVLGSAPGPLQLLPSCDYGMGWLRIRDGERLVTLPVSDPYSEIYTVRGTWWGLCDDQLLNPADTAKASVDQDWTNFEDLIRNEVRTFHSEISEKYHVNSYAFYGEDERHMSYGQVMWEQKTPSLMRGGVAPMANLLATRGDDDPATDGKTVRVMHAEKVTHSKFVLREADEHGDGTVPVRSGYAPAQRVHFCVPFAGVDHEKAFMPDATRLFTLGAITRITQSVKGTALDYAA